MNTALIVALGILLTLALGLMAAAWVGARWGDAIAESLRLRRRVRWLEAELAAQRQLTQANAATLLAGVYGIPIDAATALLEPIETLTEEEYGRE